MGIRTVIPRYTENGESIIGLPDVCFAITNSQRSDIACPQFYRFRHVESIRPQSFSFKLKYGTAWHRVAETVFRFWMNEGNRHIPMELVSDEIANIHRDWEIESASHRFNDVNIDDEIEKLTRAWEGWFHVWGTKLAKNFEVAGVEIPFARPVVEPSGDPYCPSMPVIVDAEGKPLRLCKTFECTHDETGQPHAHINIPWYQVGRLDAVIFDRDTNSYWVWDHKTSANPQSFLSNISVDPQGQGYTWLLEHAIREGWFGDDREAKVGGLVYDVVSNRKQYDPKILKSTGKLSTASKLTVPSWRFERALDVRGESPAQYADHIEQLKRSIDARLYRRDFDWIGPETRARYQRELYGSCKTIHRIYCKSAMASSDADLDTDVTRVPICRSNAMNCPYRGPCLQDGPEMRRTFDIIDGLHWSRDDSTTTTNKIEDLGW